MVESWTWKWKKKVFFVNFARFAESEPPSLLVVFKFYILRLKLIDMPGFAESESLNRII